MRRSKGNGGRQSKIKNENGKTGFVQPIQKKTTRNRGEGSGGPIQGGRDQEPGANSLKSNLEREVSRRNS